MRILQHSHFWTNNGWHSPNVYLLSPPINSSEGPPLRTRIHIVGSPVWACLLWWDGVGVIRRTLMEQLSAVPDTGGCIPISIYGYWIPICDHLVPVYGHYEKDTMERRSAVPDSAVPWAKPLDEGLDPPGAFNFRASSKLNASLDSS